MTDLPLKKLDKTSASLQILVSLFEEGDNHRTGFISYNPRGIASQSAVVNTLKTLEELELVETYDTLTGLTKVLQINYTLTEKGKKVAAHIASIKNLLDQNTP